MAVNIANNIAKHLALFTEEVRQVLTDASQEVAEAGASELRQQSPKRTGKYSANWQVKRTKKGFVIFNKDKYRLTHLLEKGHAKRNGGRTKAVVHIKPVEEKAIDIFEKKILELLGG